MSEDQAIACRVESVTGAVATLRPSDPASRRVRSANPRATGYLLFEHQGSLVALRGLAATASTEGRELDFVVTDGVQLPERRTGERIPLIARARIAPFDEADGETAWIDSATANVSLSGALVQRAPGLKLGSRFKLELFVADPGPPITCEAQRARHTHNQIGLRFTGITESDRVRLAGIIFRHQRLNL